MIYFENIGVAFSHLMNSFLGSKKRMTLSGRLYLYSLEGHFLGNIGRQFVDLLFFWQEAHCRDSWENDVKNAGQILSIHARLNR